jgi:hypothetical protein
MNYEPEIIEGEVTYQHGTEDPWTDSFFVFQYAYVKPQPATHEHPRVPEMVQFHLKRCEEIHVYDEQGNYQRRIKPAGDGNNAMCRAFEMDMMQDDSLIDAIRRLCLADVAQHCCDDSEEYDPEQEWEGEDDDFHWYGDGEEFPDE